MSNTRSSVATIIPGASPGASPTIAIISVGNFHIVAVVSSDTNYTTANITSPNVQVYSDIPTIVFSSMVTSQSPYTYMPTNSYEYTGGAARITNNTGQTLIYSIVNTDGVTPSLIATIDPTGYFLTTVSCGSFMISATADVSSNGDFGSNTALSDTIEIEKANPVILQYPQITLNSSVTSSTLVYGQSYTITPSQTQITSNTDTNPYPNINYTSSDETVAKISGTNVTIVGIGHFQILVTVSPTTNYNQILRSPSPQIYDTIQAIPTISNFPTTALLAQTWVYGQQYSGIIPYPTSIPTSNTDINPLNISYSISNTSIATISGNTITIVGVGNFQILVTIGATTNFSTMTYTYPSSTPNYQTIPATPTITFPTNFTTSSRYGSTYVFVPPTLSNFDPSQSLTYSIYPTNSPVATINYAQNLTSPSFVINSVGTFQINASCGASTNGYYSAAPLNPLLPILSPTITIANEMPIIAFNTTNFLSQYTCQPSSPYSFSGPIASITNNNVQALTYSIVATDGVTSSSIATISSNGTNLTTNSVGSFQILAIATATTNGDYGGNNLPSETITIISATPTITTFPTLTSTFIYGNTYTIPYSSSPPYTITTSNTDIPGPEITYSSPNTGVATISGEATCLSNTAISSITGTTITIIGIGNFQITVTIGATTNYNAVTYTYPSPSTYYTSIQATPTISPFSSNFGSGWVVGGTYALTNSVNVTTNAGSGYTDPNQVTYSMDTNNNKVTSNNTVKMVAVGWGGTNSFAYSYDGINWTGSGNTGVISNAVCVAWNGNMWVGGGYGINSIVYSMNGINWFPSSNGSAVFTTTLNGIAWNGSIWVAVGSGGNSIGYSYDGLNWAGSNNSTTIFSTIGMGIAWNGSIWVAVGDGGNSIAYSSDGLNWTGSNNSTTIFSTWGADVAWNGSIWVAVGYGYGGNSIAYSSDGINWTGSSSNISTAIFTTWGEGVAWNGSIWVAVGSGRNTIAYSTDGINWTGSNNGNSIFPYTSTQVAWSGSNWVAVALGYGGNSIAYSSDGSNWTGVANSNSIFSNVLGIASTSGVVFYTNQGNANNIATITTSGSGSQITINDVGSFQIQAEMAATPNFLPALPVQSNTIKISPLNVALTYNFANLGCVYGGGPYTLPSNPTNNTDPTPIITYSIVPQSGSTGNGTISTSNGITQLTITAAGGAYIYVNIAATENFAGNSFTVLVTITQATPTLALNTGWLNSAQFTYYIGSSLYVLAFIETNSNTDPGLTYSYLITNVNGGNVASLYKNTSTLYCNGPGIFTVTITSNATANFYAQSATSPWMYVSVVPEVIIFNNPQVFPPQASIVGEVGMAICLPSDSYPYGFGNYSQLVITNVSQNGATFTLNANTTPTFNSVLEKYMVFFEPNTAGALSGALSTSTASNIGYAGQNNIATGMSTGQNLTFTFTGNTSGQGFPDPLTISWDLSNQLDLTQGLVFGSFYSYINNITSPQNLPGGTGVTFYTLNYPGVTGYFIAPWAGYANTTTGIPALTALGFTTIQQAWGVWVNINYGDQFGSTITFNNGGNYCYVGIPQIVNPITYYP